MPASNTSLILKVLDNQDLTTRELSSITKLTPKQISKLCSCLEGDGLLEHTSSAWHKPDQPHT